MPWSSRKHPLDETESIGFIPTCKKASPYFESLIIILKHFSIKTLSLTTPWHNHNLDEKMH